MIHDVYTYSTSDNRMIAANLNDELILIKFRPHAFKVNHIPSHADTAGAFCVHDYMLSQIFHHLVIKISYCLIILPYDKYKRRGKQCIA